MNARILLFGLTADVIGKRELDVSFNSNDSVGDVITRLAADHPELGRHKLLFALNEEYVTADRRLTHGDELAIFTPVSGG